VADAGKDPKAAIQRTTEGNVGGPLDALQPIVAISVASAAVVQAWLLLTGRVEKKGLEGLIKEQNVEVGRTREALNDARARARGRADELLEEAQGELAAITSQLEQAVHEQVETAKLRDEAMINAARAQSVLERTEQRLTMTTGQLERAKQASRQLESEKATFVHLQSTLAEQTKQRQEKEQLLKEQTEKLKLIMALFEERTSEALKMQGEAVEKMDSVCSDDDEGCLLEGTKA
jgi:hypothetical protein